MRREIHCFATHALLPAVSHYERDTAGARYASVPAVGGAEILMSWFHRFLHEDKTGYYPAEEPWVVAITVKDRIGGDGKGTGYNTYHEYFEKDWCLDTSDMFFGAEHWYSAEERAKSYADDVREGGYVREHPGGPETHFPAHRIHRIQVVPQDETD